MNDFDLACMQRALRLARRGEGWVEPNPMVGCVLAQGAKIVGEGWHRRFGGPHAEVEAIQAAQQAGAVMAGGTVYVTLEPCCHFGKTPPCTKALIAAGVRRVVAALADPFPQVAGGGLAELQRAGIEVELGLCDEQAQALNAPYLKVCRQGRPWIIAKWAMTLDGRIAAAGGDSRWISGERSRAIVHELRGRVDAILVGRGTAAADDPLLTARPPGPRTAVRIVVDSQASLSLESQLVRTARQASVLVAAGPAAAPSRVEKLEEAGCEVLRLPQAEPGARLLALLDELGRRRLTNVLVEGGSRLLGSLHDLEQIDELHVFIAPKLIGGEQASGPVGGAGHAIMSQATRLTRHRVSLVDGDVYLQARVRAELP